MLELTPTRPGPAARRLQSLVFDGLHAYGGLGEDVAMLVRRVRGGDLAAQQRRVTGEMPPRTRPLSGPP